MPNGSKKKLPGHELLTWTDSLRASVQPSQLQRDPRTGAVSDPQEDFLRERIKVRQAEAAAEQKAAAEAMKRKLKDDDTAKND